MVVAIQKFKDSKFKNSKWNNIQIFTGEKTKRSSNQSAKKLTNDVKPRNVGRFWLAGCAQIKIFVVIAIAMNIIIIEYGGIFAVVMVEILNSRYSKNSIIGLVSTI